MSVVDQALTTRARLKTFLGIRSADTKHDTALDSLINSVTFSIENYCKRRFNRTIYTNELYDGSGGATLLLKNYPVISGTVTLQRRDSLGNEGNWQTIDAEDYFVNLKAGILEYVAGKFSERPQSHRVTYTAGYYLPADDNYDEGADDSLPNDVEMAAHLLIGKIFRQLRKQGTGISQVDISDARITFRKDILLDEVIRSILAPYKRQDHV